MGVTSAGGEAQTQANREIDEQFQDALNWCNYWSSTVSRKISGINANPAATDLTEAEKNALIANQLKNDVSQGLLPVNFISGAEGLSGAGEQVY